MGNKDEKTFTDLFASSTKESETNTQTFSDVLDNAKEKIQKEESKVTFDSLFDKIQINKETNNQPITETTENKQETINLKSKFEEQNLVDGEQQNNTAQTNDNNMNPEPQKKESVITVDATEVNPFFAKENVEEKQDNENEKTKEKETKEENTQNLFFQMNNEKENENSELTEKQEIVKSTGSTVSQEITNPKEPIELNVNPFLNNETTTIKEVMPPQNSETDIVINPIFKEEKKIEENPFITTNIENNKTESILENNNTPNSKKEQQGETTKSNSPFFEEEKKTEENPFFQNQLNLVENQAPNTPKHNIDTSKSKHYNIKIVKKKEPLIKFILGVLSYALFIWLLLIGITLLIYVLDIKIRAAKGDYSTPTFNAYVVLTGSMLPDIQVYDVVVTKKVPAKELKEKDIITFASADQRFLGTIITHRIIKKNPPTETSGYTFQTKGDNNNVADSALVPENNIFGKVILKIPKLGYLQEFLASDGGWIIVILIPCLTVISFDTVKLIKGLKRKKYKNIKVQK